MSSGQTCFLYSPLPVGASAAFLLEVDSDCPVRLLAPLQVDINCPVDLLAPLQVDSDCPVHLLDPLQADSDCPVHLLDPLQVDSDCPVRLLAPLQVDSDCPVRLRLLDLPFSAVEWVQPAESLTTPLCSVDSIATWHQQQHQQQPPSCTGLPPDGAAAAGDGSTAGPSGNSGNSKGNSGSGDPEERLAFTLGDGRAGMLSVCGRHVMDARAKRPVSGSGQVCGFFLAGGGLSQAKRESGQEEAASEEERGHER